MLSELEELEKNPKFKAWKLKHKNHFLSSIFSMEPDNAQFCYANSKGDRITTICLRTGSVEISDKEEIFKSPETKLLPLKLNEVKLSLGQATKKAISFQESNYKQHMPQKQIVILQNLPVGQVYNITLITTGFHILNLKVDSASGKVKEHSLTSMFDFVQKDTKDYIG
jgi:hypothetical protein